MQKIIICMANEQQINEFAQCTRRLLLKYKEMQKELAGVKQQLEAQKAEVAEMELLANASMKDYDMLKMAKMLEVSDGDIEMTRKRVNKLIRDVDRCITLLNEQQS